MTDIDKVVAEMRRKLAASASDPAAIARVTAIADKRHAFSISKGLRCPKALQCKICWPDPAVREDITEGGMSDKKERPRDGWGTGRYDDEFWGMYPSGTDDTKGCMVLRNRTLAGDPQDCGYPDCACDLDIAQRAP